MDYSVRQLKGIYQKEAEIDNKVSLDLGDEERKNKLVVLTAESDPLTLSMKEVVGDKV